VKNEGQNHKVKKMRAKSQLHFKAGVRTKKTNILMPEPLQGVI